RPPPARLVSLLSQTLCHWLPRTDCAGFIDEGEYSSGSRGSRLWLGPCEKWGPYQRSKIGGAHAFWSLTAYWVGCVRPLSGSRQVLAEQGEWYRSWTNKLTPWILTPWRLHSFVDICNRC